MSNKFEDILTSLQDNQEDGAKLMNLLNEVRRKVDVGYPEYKNYITKIREKGSGKQIISALLSSKKEIISVALSILGNCCLDKQFSTYVMTQCTVLSSLNQVLKRFPKEDAIHGRVSRVVGNLCQHQADRANMIVDKKPQILIHIVQYLRDSVDDDHKRVSDSTILMGVRSLQKLLNRNTLKKLVSSYSVLKTVGMLLIKYGTIWQETKKSKGVVLNIINLLLEYSKYRHAPILAELRNTDKGDSIAYLAKILLIAPQQVNKIVMNFLRISQLKSDLPIPEIFNIFVQVLQDKSLIQDFNPACETYINCLCDLLKDPSNRFDAQYGDTIPLLINVFNDLTLENRKKIQCCYKIILTLIKCRYCDSLINKQISCDIVMVLTEKLKLLVGGVQPFNVNHDTDKERYSNFRNFRGAKRKRSDYGGCSECLEYRSSSDEDELPFCIGMSPGCSNESYLPESGCSPSSSCEFFGFNMSGTDSDDYSPVCSEVDPSEIPMVPWEDVELESKNSNNIADDERSTSTGYDAFNFPHFSLDNKKEQKNELVREIINLLKSYIKIRPAVTQLGNPDLLLCLIKCSSHLEAPYLSIARDIVDMICKILNSHDYLLPLMATNFIPVVYELQNPQHNFSCSTCHQFEWMSTAIIKKLTKMAESGGGKGDISHLLFRGDDALKQKTVLIIPYIVRKPLLVRLMVNCGGLEIILKLLQETSPAQTGSIKALCVLASIRLEIPNPATIIGSCKWNLDTNWTRSDPQTLVTFKLDDGSVIDVDRDMLSQNSDFFAAMLNGSFKESRQDVITLRNVDKKAFNFLIDFMTCDSDKTDLVDIVIDLHAHLDAIELCDRFLMEDRRGYLADCVEKFRFSSENIPIIYKWSIESKTDILRVESIAFALVGNVTDSERCEMFKKLLKLEYTAEFVEDVRSILTRYLAVKQNCKCKSKKRVKFCNRTFM